MSQVEQHKKQDRQTLYAMGRIYCSAKHPETDKGKDKVCAECRDLIEYSLYRTAVCPYNHQGNCKDCDIHCYNEEKVAGVKEIMRFAAPRMIYKHPVMTARYAYKTLRK